MKGHHNGTEGSYLKAVASSAKSHVAHTEDSFVVIFKFHHIRGHIAVPWSAKPSFYFHICNRTPHWAYIAVNNNDEYNEATDITRSFLLPLQLCHNEVRVYKTGLLKHELGVQHVLPCSSPTVIWRLRFVDSSSALLLIMNYDDIHYFELCIFSSEVTQKT